MRISLLVLLLAYGAMAKATNDIAYLRLIDGYWQVWLTDKTGESHTQITHDKYDFSRVHWPLNHAFLLASRADGALIKIEPETGQQEQIKLPFDEILDASVSPNGEWLAFSYVVKEEIQATIDVWRAKIDGSMSQKLTDTPQAQVIPVWSADGEKLAFTSLSIEGEKEYELWEIQLDTRTLSQLTAGSGYNFDPAYGPEGALAYTSNLAGQYDIWMMTPDQKRHQLTNDTSTQEQPAWSRDGKHLVYVSFHEGKQRLWVMDRQGENAHPITPENSASRAPAWFN